MSRDKVEPVGIAVLAKAPIPGLAKTRLIPVLGAHGAAALQDRLTERAIETACASAVGRVTLWGMPDITHIAFRDLAACYSIVVRRQVDGDLGVRMLTALGNTPTLVIGTDCPALTVDHLREAADALRDGADVVTIPAEDGGYVLIGTRASQPKLFTGMTWGIPSVMSETRRRAREQDIVVRELAPLWDVDRPEDVERLEAELGMIIG